jgi:hypothetical protein
MKTMDALTRLMRQTARLVEACRCLVVEIRRFLIALTVLISVVRLLLALL